MMAAVVRLEWERDPSGYRIVTKQPSSNLNYKGSLLESVEDKPFLVIPRGDKLKEYVVEGSHEQVFIEFANTELKPEAVLEFAQKWGLPRGKKEAWLEMDFYEPIRNFR